MKNLLLLAGAIVFGLIGSVSAQEKPAAQMVTHSMRGFLVDQMCAGGMVKKGPEAAMAKAAKHTKACALEESCVETGFGIMSDGKWYKFDEKGDKEALALLKKTESKSNLMVEVTGSHSGDVFKVSSIKEIKADGVKADTQKKG